MLRSPFAGLSLRGLSNCIAIFNKPEITGPFTDDPIPFLDRKDRIKYQWGQQIYNLICAKACLENISSLVSDLWFDQGYRYETEWNLQTSVYGELYDYLFYLAARADADNRSLAAFTDSIQSLRDSDERLTDIEIPLERPGAVRLLTVHKSKGLEFPVVFLCCCDRQSQRSGGGGDICDTGGTGIAINPPLPARCAAVPNVRRNFFWEYSLAEEKRKKTAELRRLLYVGMTRAEKELYLAGCLDTGTGDDFSLCLKEFVNEKLEKAAGKNTIPGDTVLDNDTFFGLCLPALAGHISPGGLAAESSFFQVVEIPSYTESYIADQENRGALLPNNQRGLNAFFEKAEPFYRAVEIIHTPELSGKRITPVSLGTDTTAIFGAPFSVRRFTINKAFSGENSSDIFSQVDAMLARFTDQDSPRGEKFNSGGFGTIAHACVEALLNGVEAAIPANFAGFLNPGEAAAFLAAGRELALRFVRSPLGKTAGTAKQRKSEFTFRSMVQNASGEEVFISGTIDLLFEDKQEFQVVDFKTDSQENPLIHMAQMACYYQAVSTLFAIPARKTCRIWLYYLRTGHAVEMTEDVKDLFLNTPGGSAPRQNGETCAKDARNL
jgi:ATP-dependent helicase/nuclease subunit A